MLPTPGARVNGCGEIGQKRLEKTPEKNPRNRKKKIKSMGWLDIGGATT